MFLQVIQGVFRMKKAAFVAIVVAMVLSAVSPGFGQGRPRRVDTSRTAPTPTQPQSQQPQQDQQAPDSSDNEADPVELEGTLIEVPTVVSDRTGRYVPQLRKEDFQIYEDGQPQTIT